jgi:hypothetical protein
MFGLDIVLVPVLVDRLHLALESSMETWLVLNLVGRSDMEVTLELFLVHMFDLDIELELFLEDRYNRVLV